MISSLYELCVKVPIDLSQEVFIDPDDQVFWRKYSKGKLAGFYSAVTLAGNSAVAAYDEKTAYVVSINDGPLAVPLPPKAKKVTAVSIGRGGETFAPEPVEVHEGKALFNARRCCGEINRYEIRYSL